MINSISKTKEGLMGIVEYNDGRQTVYYSLDNPPDTAFYKEILTWLENPENKIEDYTPPAQPFSLISPRQLRLQLLSMNILPSDVDAKINALPTEQRVRAQIEWEFSITYQRDNPLVELLAQQFSLTKEQVDEAWRAAAQL